MCLGDFDRLRRHVVRGADDGLARDVNRADRDLLGNAKVDELEAALGHQKVGRLEVRVHQIALFVDKVHGLEHLVPVLTDLHA